MSTVLRIANGRTDLVFEYLAEGHSANSVDQHGVSLLQWCAYFGDVSAMKHLLLHGASLTQLGGNLDLNGACFHGHWRLVQYLIERGADVNDPLPDTGETPLHSAFCTTPSHNWVLKVLLAHGAHPNLATKPGVETGGFMRDCRTKGETPLHRAAAFADEAAIDMLIAAGARPEEKDINGDTPLTWASWYLRPAPILRKLCYGPYRIRPEHAGMSANLLGTPE